MEYSYEDLLEKMTDMKELAIPPKQGKMAEIIPAMTEGLPMIRFPIRTTNGEQTMITRGVFGWKAIGL